MSEFCLDNQNPSPEELKRIFTTIGRGSGSTLQAEFGEAGKTHVYFPNLSALQLYELQQNGIHPRPGVPGIRMF